MFGFQEKIALLWILIFNGGLHLKNAYFSLFLKKGGGGGLDCHLGLFLELWPHGPL
jgi:hypothetical protein